MMREKVPADLAAAVVLTPDEEPVRLESTWRDRTVVLAFVRHFG